MNRDEIDKVDREPVTKKTFTDALKSILLGPRGKVRSENRQPTKEELEERWKLERR